MEKKHSPEKTDLQALKWMGAVWAAVAAIFGGGLIGWLADGWLNTAPLFIVAGILLGVAGGFWSAYRTIMKSIEK